jgi:SAM-dependent methyltransferase
MPDFGMDFGSLREKWREVPQEGGRVFSDDLLRLDLSTLFENWKAYFSYYRQSEPDRWYQILYKEFMRGKSVLEIGSGLGFDGTLRLQEGAVKEWTFCDIAETNLQVIQRVCKQLGVRANFVFIDDDFKCFDKLGMFDIIWANGSLINVPFEFARAECMKILPHLKPGGRWIELCYPQERWIREGRVPFDEWGKVTDGERTPWVEWYDLVKIKRRLFPAPLEVILDFNFNNDAYNWFDLLLASDRPFDPKQVVFDLDVFPSGAVPEAHGDSVITDRDGIIDVVTPEPIWSYAASFDLASWIAQSTTAAAKVDNGFTIEIELHVFRGHIGILLVEDNISAPVCQEYMTPENTELKTLMITVPPKVAVRRLIFRNTASGTRSHFKLERIKLRFVDTQFDVNGTAGDVPTSTSLLSRIFSEFRRT